MWLEICECDSGRWMLSSTSFPWHLDCCEQCAWLATMQSLWIQEPPFFLYSKDYFVLIKTGDLKSLNNCFTLQVLEEATKALSWLQEKNGAQNKLKKTDTPLLLSADIKKKQDVLARFCDPIVSKPAPPPPKVLSHLLILVSIYLMLFKANPLLTRIYDIFILDAFWWLPANLCTLG